MWKSNHKWPNKYIFTQVVQNVRALFVCALQSDRERCDRRSVGLTPKNSNCFRKGGVALSLMCSFYSFPEIKLIFPQVEISKIMLSLYCGQCWVGYLWNVTGYTLQVKNVISNGQLLHHSNVPYCILLLLFFSNRCFKLGNKAEKCPEDITAQQNDAKQLYFHPIFSVSVTFYNFILCFNTIG